MLNEVPRLNITLPRERISGIINTAVIACNEIVNFHFDALSSADLSQPIEADARFRVRGPQMTADDRRSLHESWILAKAFQDMLRAVRHSLEEAYLFVMLLTKTHRIKSESTLGEFIEPFKRKASALSFPKLFEAVNEKLDPRIEFSAAYVSMQTARNCLEHRAGIVTKIETHGKKDFEINVPRVKAFYLRNGEEIELEPGHTIYPGDDRDEVQTFMKIEIRKRSFAIGERITLTAAEFNEISFACYFLGQQLSSRLAKPQTQTDA